MDWKNINDLFAALHRADCKYLILRNYEEIDGENFYTSGHADIDFLVENPRRFAKILHARPRFQSDDRIHYIVKIQGTDVVIDVRSIGDGYYDRRWQKNMMGTRVLHDRRFYIMDPENYYYSLVYHAAIQKPSFAQDYLERLNKMATTLGLSARTRQAHLTALDGFLKDKGYRYTLPYDIWVPLNLPEFVDKRTVYTAPNVHLRDLKQSLLKTASRIKHKIIK